MKVPSRGLSTKYLSFRFTNKAPVFSSHPRTTGAKLSFKSIIFAKSLVDSCFEFSFRTFKISSLSVSSPHFRSLLSRISWLALNFRRSYTKSNQLELQAICRAVPLVVTRLTSIAFSLISSSETES